MLTALGRNVFLGAFVVPLVLWYIGFFGYTIFFVLQTVVCCIAIGVILSPRRPDPDMDPVTAACMNKGDFLPNGAPTHLTLAMYFEKCPTLEAVASEFTRVFSEYPRFMSVPMPKPGTAYESSWKRVDFDMESMFHLYQVKSDKELEQQVEGITLGTLRPLDPKKPLWRVDILQNSNGNSAVVWILDHMFGDGLGIMPIAMKMARSADGTPCQPPSFNPYRGGSAKISFFAKISTAFRDLIEVLLVPTGPFDTVCSLNKNPNKPKLDYDGKRVVASIPDFPLHRITNIKNSGTLRRYMGQRKDSKLNDPSLRVRGQAPFSFPRANIPGKVCNDMVFVVFDFPMKLKTAKERLQKAHEEFTKLKTSAKVFIIKLIANVGLALGLDKIVFDTNLQQWHRTSWMFSNVPGPREELWLWGEKLISFKPYYANLVSQAIFFSYNGMVSLAMVLDKTNIEYPEEIGKCFLEELDGMTEEMTKKGK